LQRVVIAIIETIGLSVAAGMISSALTERWSFGLAAGFMVTAVTLGGGFYTRVRCWLGPADQPGWVKSVILVGCCVLPMTLASVPLTFVEGGAGFALLFGILGVLVWGEIDTRIESGTRGQMSFSHAFSFGLGGLIISAIAAGILDARDVGPFMVMGGASAAAISLAIEAVSWCLPGLWFVSDKAALPVADSGDAKRVERLSTEEAAAEKWRRKQMDAIPPPPSDAPMALTVDPRMQPVGVASEVPVTSMRSGLARGFWSVFAFASLIGMVLCILLVSFVSNASAEDKVLQIVFATAAGSLMLFGFQKLSLHKRPTFWQESACPFLIAVVTTGLSICVSMLVLFHLWNEELAVAVTFAIVSSLSLLLLLASRTGLLRRLSRERRHASGDKEPFVGVFVVGAGSTKSTSATSGDVDGDPSPMKP
jgi:hypothetical protein